MVAVGGAMQARLLDAAIRQLGVDGDLLLQETAEQTFGAPLQHLTHAQLADLLGVMEQRAPERLGQDVSRELAADLDRLVDESDAIFHRRLIGAATKSVGPSAEPLLRNMCTRLGLELETVRPGEAQALAAAIRKEVAAFLGVETATALAAAIIEVAHVDSADLLPRVVTLSRERIGEAGEAVIRRMCREHLELGLDDLDGNAVRRLSRVVAESGSAAIGRARAASFCAAARLVVANPADSLRRSVLELTTRAFGPAAGDFVREACTAEGVPFEALDYEHLPWLAEVLRERAALVMGKKVAESLAASMRALPTGANRPRR